jgi:O-antigen/teichoic acid export membrane protein
VANPLPTLTKDVRPPESLVGAYMDTMAGQTIVVLMGIASGIVCARLLKADGRGHLALLLLIPSLTIRFGNLNLIQAVAHLSGANADRGPASGPSALVLALALSLGQCLFVAPALLLWLPGLAAEQRWTAVALLGLVPITYAVYVLLGTDLGKQDYFRYSLFQALPAAIYTPTLLVLAACGRVSAESFAFANLAAWVIVALLRRRELVALARSGRPTWEGIRATASCGAAFALPELAGLALMRIDYPILAYMVAPKQLGFYAAALAIAGGQAATASPVSQVCFRLTSGSRDHTGAARLLRQFRMFQTVFFGFAILAIVCMPSMIRIAFGSEFLPAVAAARWLTGAMAIWSCSQLIENGMRGLGAATYCTWANLAALAVATVLALIAVSRWGIAGMGIAMFTGQAVSLTAKAGIFAHLYGFRFTDFWGLNPSTLREFLGVLERIPRRGTLPSHASL